MKCPLCGKEMTKMNQDTKSEETLFYCERHGVMTKLSNLKEKADQIAKRA